VARARNIKPGFFKNEHLAGLPYETRLLFIGLWTLADREGRLEERAKRIKMELFPADSIEIAACLDALVASGFLIRYAKDGKNYLQIENFLKHQSPHIKEQASNIPAPDGYHAYTMPAPPDSLIPDSLIASKGGAKAPDFKPEKPAHFSFLTFSKGDGD